MNPLQLASSMTGLPSGKKPTKRGRKPSGKPGSDHLSKLQEAHGKGDHKSARLHALNYAKATSRYESETAEPVGESEEMDVPRGTMNANGTPPNVPKPTDRTALAKLAMRRKK